MEEIHTISIINMAMCTHTRTQSFVIQFNNKIKNDTNHMRYISMFILYYFFPLLPRTVIHSDLTRWIYERKKKHRVGIKYWNQTKNDKVTGSKPQKKNCIKYSCIHFKEKYFFFILNRFYSLGYCHFSVYRFSFTQCI